MRGRMCAEAGGRVRSSFSIEQGKCQHWEGMSLSSPSKNRENDPKKWGGRLAYLPSFPVHLQCALCPVLFDP